MQRILQLSIRRSLASPSSSLSGLSGALLVRSGPVVCQLYGQPRLISTSILRYKQKGHSSTSSSSSSSSNDQHHDGKKKRSLMDVANDTLENVGLKGHTKIHADHTNQAGRSDKKPKPGHKSSGSQSSGNWGDSVTNVDSHKQKSSRQSNKSSSGPLNHRAAGPVRHDKKSKQFLLDLGDNKVARIEYKQIGKNLIELYHTEVPHELRGKGIGKALAKGALEAASRANLKLHVTCSFLQDYLNRFADEKYRKLVDH